MSANLLQLVEPSTLDAARNGGADAFAALVREHESMVFSLAFHFFRDPRIAEEIAQDVFLALYRALGTIESEQHLVAWLRRVTSNRCIDAARRTPVRLVAIDDVDVAHEAAAPDPFLDRRIRESLLSLPDTQRMIVTLRYQEDLEPSEIGALLDIPLNTVKSHLRRGLAALRVRLASLAPRRTR